MGAVERLMMMDVLFVNLGFKEFKGLYRNGWEQGVVLLEKDGGDLRGVRFAWFSSFWIDENGGQKNLYQNRG